MADEMVRLAQRFVNTTYNNGATLGISKLNENGVTGWPTMYALTRALQYEMGITALSDSFGPATLSAIGEKYGKLDETTIPSANFCRIIQSALYCKGYDGGEIDGTYNSRVKAAVTKLNQDMGLSVTYPGSAVWPKVAKGLFNMDAYVTVSNGSGAIRSIQQWLNGRYILRKDFYVIPCDGHHSRTVSQSMLYAVQYELGMADGVANGVFGPGTRSGLADHTLTEGSSGTWTQLFSAAMILNGRSAVSFTSSFGSALAGETAAFQTFVNLPVTGKGDFATWASLLVSYGDQNRRGEACDGITKVTPARAATLKAEGIKYVGRYLLNPSTTSLPEKEIQPGELQTISDYGLRCFPIYQTYGRDAVGFNYPSGNADGFAAINAAERHGFKSGARIFFAVDFDAYDYEVSDNILPYFKGIEDAMAISGNSYRVGVYGPRNVCIRVSEAGHATASFVSDMSSGFSGNYGYPLPPNWAYDQIVTRTLGTGDAAINVDHDIASGRDIGEGSFNAPRADGPDTGFAMGYYQVLNNNIGSYMQSIGFANEDGNRIFTHTECLDTVLAQDSLITDLSRQYNMRKSLIQTSTYWEMRHYDLIDQAVDHAVAYYHTGIGGGMTPVRDSSTGIAQISGDVGIRAWNYGIEKGFVSGTVLDPAKDADIWTMWQRVNQDKAYAVKTVSLIHLWDAGGKPGGSNPPSGETVMRAMSLNYTQFEIFQILRRYQGWGNEAEEHATKRMALYQIFEKYNALSRM
ncbi:glycoside hydrolase domain-containing protein [Streptomyces sp. Ncost-T10-10d]|uniref:glycoside hydrolase domain-containing protein n=1 Tax=Streptomyces sp. Ncost-T10-10d TaxID=1839774 RepID=UPI00081DD03C|nr:glycoside hydrolase domain-containing protein [Streptomyces sp. Ncost-T10-10d]SCF98227.1 Putative peptidoglycan binding domain-containing protein [Streptomyces sp. Ncost-T10-10d]